MDAPNPKLSCDWVQDYLSVLGFRLTRRIWGSRLGVEILGLRISG